MRGSACLSLVLCVACGAPDAFPAGAAGASGIAGANGTAGASGASGMAGAAGAAGADAGAGASFLADLPLLVPGRFTRAITSFDRTGGNDDGFAGTWSELATDPSGEHVIFDARGPGALTTLWFTGPTEGGSPLGLGRVRFYFDGATKPAIDVDGDALFTGSHPPFVAPLVFDNHATTGAFASFVRLPYAQRLRITTQNRARFYAAYYESMPPDAIVHTWQPGDESSAALAARFTAARQPSPLAATAVPLDTSGDGAGEIDLVRFAAASAPTAAALRTARIRIWWDGHALPDVDCPLGMFFGDALGPAPVHALPFFVESDVFENRMPMPFSAGYRVLVSGLDGTLSLAVGPARSDAGGSARLHAVFHEQDPDTEPDDFEYLSASGAGRLIATVLRVSPDPLVKRWWEGDLRSTTDGKHDPDVHGTGHEDDHLGGWSNTFFSRPFTLPENGEPAFEELDGTGQINGNVALYRVFDGIDFFDGIRHSVEHGTGNSVAVDYAATTFYYADPAWTATGTDSVDPSDDASRASHAYTASGESAPVLATSAYEGRESGTPVGMQHRSQSGPASFRVAIDPDNAGVLLVRSFDQTLGGQSARVSVDGADVTTWATAEHNPALIWGEREIFLPAGVTAGKSAIEIGIAPEPGSPPWDVARYRVVTLRHAP